MPGDKGDQGERVSTAYNYIPVLYIYSTYVCVGVQVLHALFAITCSYYQIIIYKGVPLRVTPIYMYVCVCEGNPPINVCVCVCV